MVCLYPFDKRGETDWQDTQPEVGDLGRRYADELEELASTYEAMKRLHGGELGALAHAHTHFDRKNAYFVGSGGAIALAYFAANMHARRSVHASQALTPLGLSLGRGLRISNSAVGLFSARARHPDVRLAARAARAQPGNRVVLLTQLEEADLDPVLRSVVDEVVTFPKTTKDGFLATNSILAMAAAWAAGAGFELPARLPQLDRAAPEWPNGATRALVLYGPDQKAAAYDLEARLAETGLLDVQLADLRNMAHGRHVGLLNRADSTAVVALGDPGCQPLLDRTLAVLPSSLRIVDLASTLTGPGSTLDSLAGTMKLVGSVADSLARDPGQPHVSAAGRKLYHLPWARLAVAPDGLRPARVKASAAGMTDTDPAEFEAWSQAFGNWMSAVSGRRVRAVVLDYDGTCVHTPRRTMPPSAEVQAELTRLMQTDVRIAFASGRGPSVMDDLRRWVPEGHWASIIVGLYNGGVITSLANTVERGSRPDGDLALAAQLLNEGLVGKGWSVAARRWQVTVERRHPRPADAAELVMAVLAPRLAGRVRVVQSGHSVDIVPVNTSKRAVVDRLGEDKTEILLIGDQGQSGGNDFDLLSYSDMSLSVERVSADKSRCWNLSTDGRFGPDLLPQYLRAVRKRGSRNSFIWKKATRTGVS